MTKQYDVIIVGGGPAGLFAALELSQRSGLDILLLEKGRDIDRRQCLARDSGGACISCSPRHLGTERCLSVLKAMKDYLISRVEFKLEAVGYEVIEVYPYASKVRLFGRLIPAKTKTAGLTFLKQNIGSLIPGISGYVDGFNHHLYDAAIAAYTAFLYGEGKTEPVGDAGEGVIYLPLVDSGH